MTFYRNTRFAFMESFLVSFDQRYFQTLCLQGINLATIKKGGVGKRENGKETNEEIWQKKKNVFITCKFKIFWTMFY